MLPTTLSSVLLYAAVRIIVLNALFGGPIMENTKNQHLEQKNLSEQPWSVEKMVRIPSTSIWPERLHIDYTTQKRDTVLATNVIMSFK